MSKTKTKRWLLLSALLGILICSRCSSSEQRTLAETFTATNIVGTATISTPSYTATGGTNPTIKVCNASPPSSVENAGSLCLDTTASMLYQTSGGGTWTQVGGGTTTGSIAIATFTPGNFDTSVVGQYDWLFTESSGTSKSTWHNKQKGGWLINSFDFVLPSGASTATDSRSWIFTSVGTDDVVTNGYSSTRNFNGPNGSDKLNAGFRFRLPTSPTSRTVKWEGTMFNAQTTISASIDCPGAATPQALAINTAASSGLDYGAQVTYSGPAGCWLVVTHTITVLIGGSSGNLYVGGIGAT